MHLIGRMDAVKAQIYDQSYNIHAETEAEEAYARRLAAYVDEKMQTVANASHIVDSLRVAVLAALNIADELFTLRTGQERETAPLREHLEKCVELVDKALRQSS
jgi:cell division protein ZapA